MRGVFLACACASVLCVALICIFLFANSLPAIGKIGPLQFLLGDKWTPSRELFGIAAMIVGSLCVTAGAILFGVPVGVLCAVYLAKFAGKKTSRALRPAVNLMAGLPSVVYGFWGLVVLTPLMRNLFGAGKSMLTASLLLGVMILPTVVSVSESAIRAVPESYYEGALALGASHERSVFFVVLPAAKSGVLAAIVLGIGRAVGETMAVIMVAGNQAVFPKSIFSGLRTMTANIVLEMGYAQGLHREALIATAAALFVFVLLLNFLLSLLKREKKDRGARKSPRLPSLPRPPSALLKWAARVAAALTFSLVLVIVGYIFINGIPNLKPGLFAPEYNSENVSMLPAIGSTVYMTLLSLLAAAPFGIFAAIYLAEYAKRDNMIIKVVRLAAETLAGIPSIVYGLFGLLFYVKFLQWRQSLLAGAGTPAIMILPLIMRATEEALLAVPLSYREGAFGLGAGRLRTVFKVVLPSAVPGILAGVILAMGRIVGETAALIYTAGTVAAFSLNPMQSARTLSVHIYRLSGEGLYIGETFATAAVLVLLVAGLNALSSFVAKQMIRKQG